MDFTGDVNSRHLPASSSWPPSPNKNYRDASPIVGRVARDEGESTAESEDHIDLNPGEEHIPGGGLGAGAAQSHVPIQLYRICIISDFFVPRLGGVELHQYQLAQGLIQRGHKVVIVTGTYGDNEGRSLRQGIRYLTNGLKVYYCPQMEISSQASMPLLTFFPVFRQILIREKIQLVHGHQTTSALAHEGILHAKTMGLKAVFTDHSLFGFADAASIHLNKFMKFTLSDVDYAICVSHCSKENLVLRACLNPNRVMVIPNAVDTTNFTPDPTAAPNPDERFNIVILSRLVYRKGVDLVVDVIPEICLRFPKVHFIIGGDGNKRILIEEMREKFQLQDRVEVLGAVRHEDVRNVLVRGHLFLNASLTEAFCIAILEAVSCGLFVVSTRVGGVPEILPHHMIRFAEPRADDIIEALSDAIGYTKFVDPLALHEQVRTMYNWHDVAARTEIVYDRAMGNQQNNELGQSTNQPSHELGQPVNQPSHELLDRLNKYVECGPFAGPLFCMVVALDYLIWQVLKWIWPADQIDPAPTFPSRTRRD